MRLDLNITNSNLLTFEKNSPRKIICLDHTYAMHAMHALQIASYAVQALQTTASYTVHIE